MKILIVSDLHLEFSDYELENPKNADTLIISGDLCTATKSALSKIHKFLKEVSTNFNNIIYVAGNHEYYGSYLTKGVEETLQGICANYSNVHYLQNSRVNIGNHIFVGSTLWTSYNNGNPIDMQIIRSSLNDYKRIRLFSPTLGFKFHRESVKYIEETCNTYKDLPVIVCTHHAPSYKSICERYKGDLDHAYASDLSDTILNNSNIILWAHGHTHSASDYEIGDCRVVCNPRGYDGYERGTGFDPYKILIV